MEAETAKTAHHSLCLKHFRRQSENNSDGRFDFPKAYYGRPLTNHPFLNRAKQQLAYGHVCALQKEHTAIQGIRNKAGTEANTFRCLQQPRHLLLSTTLDHQRNENARAFFSLKNQGIKLPIILHKGECSSPKRAEEDNCVPLPGCPSISSPLSISYTQDSHALNRKGNQSAAKPRKHEGESLGIVNRTFQRSALYTSRRKSSQLEGRLAQINNLGICLEYEKERQSSVWSPLLPVSKIQTPVSECQITFMKINSVEEPVQNSVPAEPDYNIKISDPLDANKATEMQPNDSQCSFASPQPQFQRNEDPDSLRQFTKSPTFNNSLLSDVHTEQQKPSSPKSKREIRQLFSIPSSIKRRKLQRFILNKRNHSIIS